MATKKRDNAKNTIAFAGGGTGGHIYPALNVCKYITREKPDTRAIWIGEKNSLEQSISRSESIPFYGVQCGKLRRYFSLRTAVAPFQVIIGIVQSLYILRKQGVTSVFSKGGYVSVPVCIAAWICKIPVTLHESDSVAGLANKICGKFATHIYLNFSEAKKFFDERKVRSTEPLLPEKIIDSANDSTKAKDQGNPLKVLVSCGSQGARSVFDTIAHQATSLREFEFHIILGTKNARYVGFDNISNMQVLPFFEDQNAYLEKLDEIDIVIARGGGSIFEFAALGLPMIMIPHPYTGGNHQYYNAKALERYGHLLLEQDRMTSGLESTLRSIAKSSIEKLPVSRNVYREILADLTSSDRSSPD